MSKRHYDAYSFDRGLTYEANMEKVAAAFKAMRANGLVARQNFMCCGSCASSALSDQLNKARGKGKAVKGAVYFHRQDSECALDYGKLYIGFGAGGENAEADCLEVGRIAVECLRAAGLEVKWDNSVWTRPVVTIWRSERDQAQFDRDGIMLPDCD